MAYTSFSSLLKTVVLVTTQDSSTSDPSDNPPGYERPLNFQ